MDINLYLKQLLIISIILLQFFSKAIGATQVADEVIEFNRIYQHSSINCPYAAQAAIIDHPLFVTFIISQNPKNNSGFGDLFLSTETFQTSNYLPQIVLKNEGLLGNFDLLGAGTTDKNGNLNITVPIENWIFYLDIIATDDITPATGNNGSAVMSLSLNPQNPAQSLCAVQGQVVESMPFINQFE